MESSQSAQAAAMSRAIRDGLEPGRKPPRSTSTAWSSSLIYSRHQVTSRSSSSTSPLPGYRASIKLLLGEVEDIRQQKFSSKISGGTACSSWSCKW